MGTNRKITKEEAEAIDALAHEIALVAVRHGEPKPSVIAPLPIELIDMIARRGGPQYDPTTVTNNYLINKIGEDHGNV